MAFVADVSGKTFNRTGALLACGLVALRILAGMSIAFALLIGFAMVLVGGWNDTRVARVDSVAFVFDRATQSYWQEDPSNPYGPTGNKGQVSDIHALQTLAECHDGGEYGDYYTYQLNLVLADGSRRNVTNNGNRKRLHDDATTLGEFLGVPVWRALG